jgi:hypothetical protein
MATMSKDAVAQLIVAEAKARGHIREEALGELSALDQESGLDDEIWDPKHVTYGVAQQDGSYPHRFEGAAAQVKAFFDKLDVKRTSPGHGDIWLNICWLQQAPNWPSAQYWWDHGRQAYLTEIKSKIAAVTPWLDRYWPVAVAPPPAREPYGMPTGSNSGGYSNNGVRFPDWVYRLGDAFNCKPSTYPGHQETDRIEAGYARNPQHLNRGIDWTGSVADMQRLADYLFSIRGELEQVIWENPTNGQRRGVAGGKDVTATPYYAYDGGYNEHRNHVHSRQDHALPAPGAIIVPGPLVTPVPAVFRPLVGDPVWIPDVLRAEGLVCNEINGWRDRGHGDFGEIWGIVCHHTGSNNASPESIAFHPELGLASQLHLSRTGVYTMCGVGIAWHAGSGSYPGLPTNGANAKTIGIEAANDGGGSPGKPHRSSWPDVQYDAYVRGVAAILRKLDRGQ